MVKKTATKKPMMKKTATKKPMMKKTKTKTKTMVKDIKTMKGPKGNLVGKMKMKTTRTKYM